MDNQTLKILVVDDEESIREGLRDYLELEGFHAEAAASAEEALALGLDRYDLVLLDVMMEGMDGFELARRMKTDPATADIPVIFLTAKDSDDDMVAGLHLGADDYISKPFSVRNVIARIEAVMRRVSPQPLKPQGDISGGVRCDRPSLSCTVDGHELKLPRKEFEILALLLENPGRIFSREELMSRIWPGGVVVTDRTVDVHITRIRSKIAPYGRNIVSRSGYGYGWHEA